MTDDLPEYMTTAEVAKIIRTSEDYVSRKCASGEIRAKKIGRTWRITREAVAAFMAPGRAAPTRIRRRAS